MAPDRADLSGVGVERLHPVLPMFRLQYPDRAVLYAPGRAMAADTDWPAFEAQARLADRAWTEFVARPYRPECLTLYLSNQCNLGCTYCYSTPLQPERARARLHPAGAIAPTFPTLNEDAAVAAARLVARNCQLKGKPLSLIFHGGGEPTLHWELLTRLRMSIGSIAAEHGLPMWSYIATNGVLSDSKVDWLAEQFSIVGVSCDGPRDIQDRQRPTAKGASSASAVERTATRLAARGAEFHVRVTITPASVQRQRDIVTYCVESLRARTIRFEPAYQPTGGDGYFRAEQAEAFVEHFLDARDEAAARGAQLHLSGVRIGDIHGPYCNPLRDVLQLSPDGRASACFLTADGDRPDDATLMLGWYDSGSGEFVLNEDRAAALRRQAARIPDRCQRCVNVYHCARDCPDVCVITAASHEQSVPGFRCRMQKLLAHALIGEMATAAS